MNNRQRIFLTVAVSALLLDTLYLFIHRALSASGALQADLLHTTLILFAFAGGGIYYYRASMGEEEQPMRLIGRLVIAATLFMLVIGITQLAATTHFTVTIHSEVTSDGDVLAPSSFAALVITIVLSVIGGVCALMVFSSLTRLVFLKRKKRTRRNFLLLLISGGTYIILDFLADANGFGLRSIETFGIIAYTITIIAILINAFHFSWILLLSRREKLINLMLTLLGFTLFLILTIYVNNESETALALRAYHPMLQSFVSTVFEFATASMGIGFAGTLLHLPTAREFDRKKMEISSLRNLSRLITQVFDFDELMTTTTHLALEVSEGDAAWLEIFTSTGRANSGHTAMRNGTRTSLLNITNDDIALLRTSDGGPLRQLALTTGGPVLIQDLASDLRLDVKTRDSRSIGTILMLPLSSHGDIIGLLNVTKQEAYAFDQDAMNVLSAFADMVSVAIENSNLIRESIVKERMQQELLVAQEMQRSLLPQQLPHSSRFEIAARSLPAFEVGGDYFDVMPLDETHLGVVVGDVSGKGVSAALYMAQLKGIFQALTSADTFSTRDILIRMNTPLCLSMERKSFISLLYAILDTQNGVLTYSRAGHCPLLHVRNGQAHYLQPGGMALGLDDGTRFSDTLREEQLKLEDGDILVMYTDGITEARNPQDEEFQYERLTRSATAKVNGSAGEILDAIIADVHTYSARADAEDDMTLLVLRWGGRV
ncbi:MAG: SpoIIE family protein phosphatase [Bacteroidetes bacterium]|nr:SpoIIE family protein phosphatase [Bacteroidota bacterium]